jgi:hypothetical protein
MDDLSKARLELLMKKEPEELTSDDVAFLKARKEYMTDKQEKKYAVIMAEDKPKKTTKK